MPVYIVCWILFTLFTLQYFFLISFFNLQHNETKKNDIQMVWNKMNSPWFWLQNIFIFNDIDDVHIAPILFFQIVHKFLYLFSSWKMMRYAEFHVLRCTWNRMQERGNKYALSVAWHEMYKKHNSTAILHSKNSKKEAIPE